MRDIKLGVGYVLLMCCFMYYLYLVYTIPECRGCNLTFDNGDVVSGNCTEILEFKKPMKINQTALLPATCPVMICPTCHSESTTTQTTLPCTPTECPACVILDCPTCLTLTDEVISQARNYKPKPSSSVGYQSGGYDCRDYYLDLFDIPNRSRFSSRPSMGLKPLGDYGGLINDTEKSNITWNPKPIIRWNET